MVVTAEETKLSFGSFIVIRRYRLYYNFFFNFSFSFNFSISICVLEHRTTAVAFLLFLGTKVHFPHYFREHFVHVCSVFGTGLHERTTP